MGRTAAACGFRWNSTVRKQYDAAIAIAKSQRQQLKKIGRLGAGEITPQLATADVEERKHVSVSADEELQLEAAIRLLMNQKETMRRLRQLERELDNRNQEIKELQEERNRMKKELDNVQGVNDDYKALLQIMERARKLAFLKEDDKVKPVFKMDANGNLERVE